MLFSLVAVFVLVYAAIAFEHPLGINKSASALVGAGLMWTIYAVTSGDTHTTAGQLAETLQSTAQIAFFLMGAMTIVEVVDAHDGFEVITARIKTTRLSRLAWIVASVSFVLSAILDNLTTTIVMVSLMKRLLNKREDRLYFAALIVISANAGGAWTPIGDVTTTMLWIGGQITATAIMKALFLPSLANMIVPLTVSSFYFGDRLVAPNADRVPDERASMANAMESKLILFMGLGLLILVPAFKSLTHLPPFMGILFGLGILWVTGDLIHRDRDSQEKQRLTIARALTRIDMSAIIFFIGILLSVAVLEHTHVLALLATWLDHLIGRQDIIVMLIGLASAVVDNVPLVAASMGMYSLAQYPADSFLWEFMAYCAGTGGSILIIGSAAGVAAMGLEKIEFIWYLRKIGGMALAGYLAGALVYLAQYHLLH